MQLDELRSLIGARVTTAKTVTETDVYLFAGITGDFCPNHVNEAYCRGTSLGRRIAHGALTVGYMSTASSELFKSVPIHVVSLGYDHVRFLKPVFFGDTLTVDYEITAIDEAKRRTIARIEVRNQDMELVAVATHLQHVSLD